MRFGHMHTLEAEALSIAAAAFDDSQAPCITCSFQASGVVLLHLLRQLKRDIPVLFVDTLHHFEETYKYRDDLARAWNLRLVNVRAAEPAPGLWETSTDACCSKHKVDPLFAALETYDTWFSGLRREQSPSRANLAEVAAFRLPSGKSIRKVSPLAGWSTQQVSDYARAHGISLLPLYDAGYTSIGCQPCTSLPLDSANPRSGRWQGQKLECGIHVQWSTDLA